MAYFARGRFVADPWATREIVPMTGWRERRDAGTLPSPLGLRLEPGFDVESAGLDLAGVDLVAISFPKFTDGRGYSMGWLLRGRMGYRGEMRAVGDVLFDQMQLMVRCGFNAFEIADAATLRLLESGRGVATIDRFYQPGLEPEVPAGTRPWARRLA